MFADLFDLAHRAPRRRARALIGRAAARSDLLDFAGAVSDFERALARLSPRSPRRERLEAVLADARQRLGETCVRGQRLIDLIESRGGWPTLGGDGSSS
ncbi:MAG TPA: hypothetical protein DEA08_33120 [Planctomycetes bacterium]|nr:hypothetical protein [Planctomycetota bacterium]